MTGWFTRPVGLACGFATAALLVLAGLGWATFTALEAEAGQREATARADRASRERLALWRLDGYVLPFVGRENARPFDDYSAATTPLLTEPLPGWVSLHLQLDPVAGWSSPQAGGGAVWAERLADLTRRLMVADAARLFAVPDPVEVTPPVAAPAFAPSKSKSRELSLEPSLGRGIGGGVGGIGGGVGGGGIGGFGVQAVPADSMTRGTGGLGGGYAQGGPQQLPAAPAEADFALRQQVYRNNLSNTAPPSQLPTPAGRPEAAKKSEAADGAAGWDMAKDRAAGRLADKLAVPPPPPGVHLGPMRAVWVPASDGDLLFLVRPVQSGTRRLYQAVWLDWPQLQAALVAQTEDLLPAADLRPAVRPTAPDRAMTVLPVDLDSGPLDLPPAGWTPLRTGLALAWVATLLALAAVAAGGRAVVALADRRVRFVSAVTHELRTPLTSLRLYLDMLAGGLVTDPDRRQEYLVTLAGESDRLHRLIENVLDFARLERRSVRANCVPVPVADLLSEVTSTWADRLATDGKELFVTSTLPPGQTLRTDPRMAGQILANLVDNARKYSRGAADPRVWVWAKPGPRGRVVFEVEDRGPGVPDSDRAGLFRAFRRGRDVDAVAGGAGLGLALAAQWAGLLGGRLSFRPADGGVGACFRLELPAAGC